MNIAFIHATLPETSGGGVSYQVHALANTLIERGHSVTMFSVDPAPADARYHNVLVRPTAPFRSELTKTLLPPFYVARQRFEGFDVIHAHGSDVVLALRRPDRYLRTFYGSCLSEARYASSLRAKLLFLIAYAFEILPARAAAVRVGISGETHRTWPWVTHIIPCGVDTARFQPGSARSSNPSILFVGTLRGRKRGALLLKIFRDEIVALMPDAELWMVCEDLRNGDEVADPRIHLMRRVSTDRLVELYQRAWVFCLPSRYEGFGIPYIEALATGTPVVATPNPGAQEVLAGGKYGLIVAERELGEAVVRLCRDLELRRQFSDSAKLWVRRFDLNAVAEQYEALYEQLGTTTSPGAIPMLTPSAKRTGWNRTA